jgi:hypothetical protein
MYFAFKASVYAKYKYNSVEPSSGTGGKQYPDGSPINKFVRPSLSYWDRFRNYVASIIHDLLIDQEIEREGLNYLDAVFRHPQT